MIIMIVIGYHHYDYHSHSHHDRQHHDRHDPHYNDRLQFMITTMIIIIIMINCTQEAWISLSLLLQESDKSQIFY